MDELYRLHTEMDLFSIYSSARSPLRGTMPARLRMASKPDCLTSKEIAAEIGMFTSLDRKLTSRRCCAISVAHPARMIDQKGRNTEMLPGAVLIFLGDAFSHQEERK
ncbi:hypothetical protein ES703_78748 [subsurface metagenome]